MKIYLVRHGMTKGNREKRYVGRTDERLLESEADALKKESPPLVDRLYVSPMQRCVETAEYMWNKVQGRKNQIELVTVPDLSECDFGMFEYKNYQELTGIKEYDDWVLSGGTLPFPGGESVEDFKKRCQRSFYEILSGEWNTGNTDAKIGFVIHGGTIMAVLDAFSSPHRDYFEWQVKNREGYVCDAVFQEDNLFLKNIGKTGGGRWNG